MRSHIQLKRANGSWIYRSGAQSGNLNQGFKLGLAEISQACGSKTSTLNIWIKQDEPPKILRWNGKKSGKKIIRYYNFAIISLHYYFIDAWFHCKVINSRTGAMPVYSASNMASFIQKVLKNKITADLWTLIYTKLKRFAHKRHSVNVVLRVPVSNEQKLKKYEGKAREGTEGKRKMCSGSTLQHPGPAYLNKVTISSLVATTSFSGSILKIAAFKNTYVAFRKRRRAAGYIQGSSRYVTFLSCKSGMTYRLPRCNT